MTLSSKQIDDIGNLYENIITSGQEEQLNEDLIGDIRANAGRVVRGIQSATGAANRAAGAVNQAMVNRITPKPTAGNYKSRFARPMNAGTPQQTGRGTAVSRPAIGSLPSNYRGQELQAGARAAASQVGTARQGSAGTGAAPSAAAPRPAARPAAGDGGPAGATTAAGPATTKSKPEAPKPLGFKPRTLTSAELAAATKARRDAREAGKSAADVEKDAITAVSKLQKSSFDIFDVIKGHLLDEGYADTEEAALAIMANMSEEWKQSIVEQSNTLVTPEQRRADELKYGMKRTTQVPPSKPGGTKTKPGSRMPL